MFKKLFGSGEHPKKTSEMDWQIEFLARGLSFPAPLGVSAKQWLGDPYTTCQHGAQQLAGACLAQLHQEELVVLEKQSVLVPWPRFYALVQAEGFEVFRQGLGVPEFSILRPGLVNKGDLLAADFSILLSGWFDDKGLPVQPQPQLIGRALIQGGQTQLVSAEVNALLDEFERFHSTPLEDRDQVFREQAFGRIRQIASSYGCPLSDYVHRTIILTPDKLGLSIERRTLGEQEVIEILPSFEGAPDAWISVFDRLDLRDKYEVPQGASMVRVILTPEVKSVLGEIKRLNRRVSGKRGQAFIRNPFSLLGEYAGKVIDSAQFERVIQEAGIVFWSFAPTVERRANGEVRAVGLNVRGESAATDLNDAQSSSQWFDDFRELGVFLHQLEHAFTDGEQTIRWRGLDLELAGETQDHIEQLRGLLIAWTQPALWTAQEVLDLSHYSERVVDIGVEARVITPVIARQDEGSGWFEGNTGIGFKLNSDGGQPLFVPLEFSHIENLATVVQHAEERGASTVQLPGLPSPVPILQAKAAVSSLAAAIDDIKKQQFKPFDQVSKKPRTSLIVKNNIDLVEHSEARSEILTLPEDTQAVLPRSLLPSVSLKSHQFVGVAWLQHLWRMSPAHCRGTVLADDMGLGKTLQLLTFMASCFEVEPDLPPALVVAPVALLENWRLELERFFLPETLPLKILYGDELRSWRVNKQELDRELASKGITKLLRKGWVGNAKLVLTTYETMRDLEFALAAQPWSIMVCDEAQKIKTPAAMVTRSAKKQKVRFKIACTGTPVENTLADLWCLFDYVQPGLLGALNQFSRTYRQPIEAKTPEQLERVHELRNLIAPQILHRKKAEVAKDLPAPVEYEACKALPMTPYQEKLYERALGQLREASESNPSAQLTALHAIRTICSDPHGYDEDHPLTIPIAKLLNESPKLNWLVQRLKELAARPGDNHKVIVFCEFRKLQIQLQRVIAAVFGIAASIVNGDTDADPKAINNRQQLIDAFQQKDDFNVIILSPVAVGFGVNIQAANHVIHFTRTWNPAKEDQATARAYRIGQKRQVTVYYPGVYSDRYPSFDVKLDALLSSKRSLAQDMLNGCRDLKASDFGSF